MWEELGYDVGQIVDKFLAEDYPVTELQIIRLIRGDERLEQERVV
jgi:hypothetical protein